MSAREPERARRGPKAPFLRVDSKLGKFANLEIPELAAAIVEECNYNDEGDSLSKLRALMKIKSYP